MDKTTIIVLCAIGMMGCATHSATLIPDRAKQHDDNLHRSLDRSLDYQERVDRLDGLLYLK